jgi:hypothetical protein
MSSTITKENDVTEKTKFSFPTIHVSYTVLIATPEFPMELRYASGQFGALVSETVEPINYGDGRSSLALETGDKPHISFMKKDEKEFTLCHALRAAGGKGWTSEVASRRPVHPGKENAIAVDSTGRVGVSHWRDDSVPMQGQTIPPFVGTRELLVSTSSARGWSEQLQKEWNIGSNHTTYPMLDTSLAYDRSDRGHLAYVRTLIGELQNPFMSGLYYTVEGRKKSWDQAIVPLAVPTPSSNLLSVSHTQIALDASDHYHIIYTTWERATTTPTKCFLRYLTNADDAPERALIAELSEDYINKEGLSWLNICGVPPPNRTAIALDPTNTVHVAYYDNGTPKEFLEDHGLWYARREAGGNWERQLVDGSPVHDVSIAVSQLGDVIIAYAEPLVDHTNLKFALGLKGQPWRLGYIQDEPALIKLGDVAVSGSRGRSNRLRSK